MSGTNSAGTIVIGVGNSWAGDDAAGILVARALRDRLPDGVDLVEHEGEPTSLIDAWAGRRLAVVVDATEGAGAPGEVRSFDATAAPLPSGFAGRSTHAFSVGQAIELARGVGRMPARLVLVGVEGRDFRAGLRPTAEVADGVERAAREVGALVRENY